ncbi:hypothetical protein BT63DRAFT_455919 [Microthyrium microscopicum]|uniref:Uncharacterized protein n=1 Tax=Microthyrium microscopicum TaxID=703497 RepID=A0A6A6UAE7_9PEZI|nr:hypothetical protein BT63DRAFT_455919 [Microthyrium microscopicum]
MAPVTSLTNDVWIEILSQLSSLDDLHGAILSSRRILDSFYERRTALLSMVLRTEIITSHEDDPYNHAKVVTARMKTKPINEAIIILAGSPKRAYLNILSGYKANSQLAAKNGNPDASNVIPRVGLNRLPRPASGPTTGRTRNINSLAVEETDSLEWGNRVVRTFRALEDGSQHTSIQDAVDFENDIEYTRAGRTDDAIAEQQRILTHLRCGSNEYIAWARQLIVMHRRAG